VSVSADFPIEYRPFSGYDDPSLPIASYIGQGGMAGDASGGSVVMSILFQQMETGRGTPNMFNLEQLSIDVATNVNFAVLMRTLNMGRLAPTRVTSPEKWVLGVTSDTVDDSALELTFLSGLPLWLDAPSNLTGDAGLRLEFTNLNLELYAATIRGYIWSPRSVLAQGGPQRPLNGMFR